MLLYFCIFKWSGQKYTSFTICLYSLVNFRKLFLLSNVICIRPGESPKPGNDTMICLSSYTSQGSSGWKSDFLPITGTKNPGGLLADLWIFTPADCIVSDWKFCVHTVYKAGMDTAMVSYEHPERIYILFNPWDKSKDAHFVHRHMYMY